MTPTVLRRATFSTRAMRSIRCYSEGSTGGTRPAASQDAFNKREKAQEDFYVKQHEKEVIAALRESLQKQRDQLSQLEEKINGFSKK